ncbi:MAG TPA: EAL domain-containing protein, partial [Polyangiaceae bacterium]
CDALTLAREFPYAVVLTDYRMPGLSGQELVQALQAIRPDATFIMLTGELDAIDGLGQLAQVHAVVAKPWAEDELFSLVERGVRDSEQRKKRRSGSSDSFIAVGGQFILLLEDNDLDALMVERSIEQAAPGEFRIVRARSLAEAKKLLQSRAYSAVLADLGLPDGHGLAALTTLLGISPDTPILALTGLDDPDLAAQAVRAGAQDYLLKGDFDSEAVLRAMRYAVERKRIEMRLSELAHYDALTGLANRTLMTEHQKRSITRAVRSERHVALIAIDLDHFKAVNDTHGHHVGDALLVEVARRLLSSTRTGDTVARIGGDEFSILLEDLDGPEGAQRVAQRIQNAFQTPILVEGKELRTTPSVGIATFPDDSSNLGELQRHADAALYEAKHAGRNTYHFFSKDMQARAQLRSELERDLSRALVDGKYRLEYLPEVDIQSGDVCSYEALLRLNRDPLGSLAAREFLHVLDGTGEIVSVGKWVVEQVCADALAFNQGSSRPRLSINVSARELANPDFVATVQAALQSCNISGERLEIELSEVCLSTNYADARVKLPQLAALGVSIAVDGYGAGRSSILELATLPIRALKLHGSFQKQIKQGYGHGPLRAIVAVASALGWSVVATCVETREQLEVLSQLGCTRAQGWFWGAPLQQPGLVGFG